MMLSITVEQYQRLSRPFIMRLRKAGYLLSFVEREILSDNELLIMCALLVASNFGENVIHFKILQNDILRQYTELCIQAEVILYSLQEKQLIFLDDKKITINSSTTKTTSLTASSFAIPMLIFSKRVVKDEDDTSHEISRLKIGVDILEKILSCYFTAKETHLFIFNFYDHLIELLKSINEKQALRIKVEYDHFLDQCPTNSSRHYKKSDLAIEMFISLINGALQNFIPQSLPTVTMPIQDIYKINEALILFMNLSNRLMQQSSLRLMGDLLRTYDETAFEKFQQQMNSSPLDEARKLKEIFIHLSVETLRAVTQKITTEMENVALVEEWLEPEAKRLRASV